MHSIREMERMAARIASRPETPAILRNQPRIGDWMQTFSGRQAWPMDLRPGEVFVEDIAHSLAMQCRYAGHCLRFYSVAEHAVHIARWLLRNGHGVDASVGLHHDDTEAYLVDVPRPAKPFLHGYKQAEDAAWRAIAERFNLPYVIPDIVHDADNRILSDERAQNMAPCVKEWAGLSSPLGVTLEFWTPAQAEQEYLNMYWKLVETGRH